MVMYGCKARLVVFVRVVGVHKHSHDVVAVIPAVSCGYLAVSPQAAQEGAGQDIAVDMQGQVGTCNVAQ
jgi:hypothetical protein